MIEQIYAQALLMAGKLTAEQENLLQMLCRVAKQQLEGRLRPGITAEDCRSDFVSAGSLLALAALSESDGGPARVPAGELPRQRGSQSAAAQCLRGQAELLMRP